MKIYPILFAVLVLAGTGAPGQQRKAHPAARIPWRTDALNLFAPHGWKIEKQINGDLNRDKKLDAALVLVESKAATVPRQRVLVVALREGKGWHRVGFSNSLLLGTRDGGAFYGAVTTPVDVAIRHGVLIVAQESGSREVLHTTHRFRFDARRKRVLLIGFDSTVRDRLDGSTQIVSANYLTGGKQTRELASTDKQSKRKTMRVSRKLRTLEEITRDERYKS